MVDGERAGRVLVRVTAAPVDGRANEAVCRVLAAHLALPARALTVVAGHHGRDKVIQVGVSRALVVGADKVPSDTLGHG